jgi:hypothetical protein
MKTYVAIVWHSRLSFPTKYAITIAQIDIVSSRRLSPIPSSFTFSGERVSRPSLLKTGCQVIRDRVMFLDLGADPISNKIACVTGDCVIREVRGDP